MSNLNLSLYMTPDALRERRFPKRNCKLSTRAHKSKFPDACHTLQVRQHNARDRLSRRENTSRKSPGMFSIGD